MLRMYRAGQTHPIALATWRSDDAADLRRIARLNSGAGVLQLTDTEAATTENL